MRNPATWLSGQSRRFGVGRLSVLTRILLLIALSFLTVLLDRPWTLSVLALGSGLALLSIRPSRQQLRLAAAVVVLTVWGMMLSQAIFYAQLPRTPLVTLVPASFPVLGSATGGIHLFREGFLYGLIQGLRVVTLLLAGLTLCWTSDPAELLVGLSRLRVPYGVAFMTVTALRFLPLVFAEVATVLQTAGLRGSNRWYHWPGILRAVFANSIRRAGVLALSVRSRAFDPVARRTSLRSVDLHKGDAIGLTTALVACVFVAATKALFWAYVSEIFYHPGLRPLYDLSRRFL